MCDSFRKFFKTKKTIFSFLGSYERPFPDDIRYQDKSKSKVIFHIQKKSEIFMNGRSLINFSTLAAWQIESQGVRQHHERGGPDQFEQEHGGTTENARNREIGLLRHIISAVRSSKGNFPE